MTGEAIVSVSASVTVLTQLVKWAGLQDSKGPFAVLILSALGVALWGFSVGTFERTQTFSYFAGWIAVASSSAGFFGFTRAVASAVTATKAPPAGAGANPTEKPLDLENGRKAGF